MQVFLLATLSLAIMMASYNFDSRVSFITGLQYFGGAWLCLLWLFRQSRSKRLFVRGWVVIIVIFASAKILFIIELVQMINNLKTFANELAVRYPDEFPPMAEVQQLMHLDPELVGRVSRIDKVDGKSKTLEAYEYCFALLTDSAVYCYSHSGITRDPNYS
jgi:hypothetical protein